MASKRLVQICAFIPSLLVVDCERNFVNKSTIYRVLDMNG
jgi:hypothetical protein